MRKLEEELAASRADIDHLEDEQVRQRNRQSESDRAHAAALAQREAERDAAVAAARQERDAAVAAARQERDAAVAAARQERDAAVAAAAQTQAELNDIRKKVSDFKAAGAEAMKTIVQGWTPPATSVWCITNDPVPSIQCTTFRQSSIAVASKLWRRSRAPKKRM
ncbi:hypothetical protein CF319_g8007 [Tilletia indica]|nr:hypothetical protein CF319_g8007 [Tilletia indica]